MKKVMLLMFPFFMGNGEVPTQEAVFESKRVIEHPIIIAPKSMNKLVTALIHVESRGNDSVIGDRHLPGNEAVGALQIRPIMVREVNRILKIQGKAKRFKLKDRFDRQKSIHIFIIWKNHHYKGKDNETIARCWNGGGNGYKNKSTEKYWDKVKQQLNN
jgi:hypothetical protein